MGRHITPEEAHVPKNYKISINYVHIKEIWDQNKVVINNIFVFQVALDIIRNYEDHKPQNVEKCRNKNDWPKWKEVMHAQLKLLMKRKVYRPVVQTPKGVKPIGYKWVFVQKRNENNEFIRYKAQLVAEGFSQRLNIDYKETCSHLMDAITFNFLISSTISEGMDMRLMNVITAYVYGSIDNDIYI